MSFVLPFLASLVATFVANGFQNVRAEKKDGNAVVFSGNKELASIPIPQETTIKPFDYITAFLKRATTNAQVQPQKPDAQFQNTLKKDVLITNISFVGDINFKSKGKALILVDGATLISIDASDLADVENVNIPIPDEGYRLGQNKKIEIFVWNGIDGTPVSLTSLIVIGVKNN